MNRSRVFFVVMLAAGALVGGGCGSSGNGAVVMVIDEGIDLTAGDLQGKVVASYTETCIDDSSSGSSDGGAVDGGGPSFATLKQMYLAALSQPDDSCLLSPGISAKADPLAKVAQFKSRWNAMVRANQTPSAVFTASEVAQLMGPLDAEIFGAFNYHGTATSSTVAHDNGGVRLVLVERQLASEGDLQTNFPCIAQADIDQTVELLSDPQIYAAAVSQPAQIDGELADAEATHHVQIVNESFGAESRETLEMLQSQYCTSPVSLSAYFTLIDKLTVDHNATIGGPSVLTVVAAGNDGVKIDTGSDSLSCDLGDPKSLLVGAYNPGTQVQNMFSNYGACVNVYAPGQAIVVDYAGGWVTWASGTSFSAPLTARLASMTEASPFDATAERTAIVAKSDPTSHFLPIGLFPSDFFYVPGTQTPEFVVPTVAAKAAPTLRPPTMYELHRVFGPLYRLKHLQGRR